MSVKNEPKKRTIEPKKRRSLKYYLYRLLRFAAILYVAILLYLVVFESRLVYPGSKYPRGDWQPSDLVFEEIAFRSDDGTQLVGWYLPKENASENVLLCHGNAENAAQASAYIGRELRDALNANVFVFDYRGYGKSGGSPSEQGVLEDSLAALNWLNEKTGTTPDTTIIVGHSIGGGPACFLAGEHGAKVLVLQRTFCSLVDAAQSKYPWVPVSLLMRNRYPSDERIENYDGPLFQSHGTHDNVIECQLGRKLFGCCPSKNKQFYELKGEGHFDVLPLEYWQALIKFVQSIEH